MTKKVIFEMDVFEMIEWINNNPLTMAQLYSLGRAGILGVENDCETMGNNR